MGAKFRTPDRNTGIISEQKQELIICNTCDNYMACICSKSLKKVSYRHTCKEWIEKIVHSIVQLKY